MNKAFFHISPLFAACAIFCACSNDVDVDADSDSSSSHNLSFAIDYDNWAVKSRSEGKILEQYTLPSDDNNCSVEVIVTDGIDSDAPRSRADEATSISSFGLLAYQGGDSWSDNLTPSFIYNVEVKSSNNFNSGKYWPKSGNLWFFAYYPYSSSNGTNGLTFPKKTTKGLPIIDYGNSNVFINRDIMTAFAGPHHYEEGNPSVPLNFKHNMAALRFVNGKLNGSMRIQSMQLKNIYTGGVYSIATDSWDTSSKKLASSALREYGSSVRVVNYYDAEGTTSLFQTSNTTLYMIPQTFSDEAVVELRLGSVSSSNYYCYIKLKGINLAAGTTTTIRVSATFSYPTLLIEPDQNIDKISKNSTFPIESEITVYSFLSSSYYNIASQSTWQFDPSKVIKFNSSYEIPDDAKALAYTRSITTVNDGTEIATPDWLEIDEQPETACRSTYKVRVLRLPEDDEVQEVYIKSSATADGACINSGRINTNCKIAFVSPSNNQSN